MITLAIIDASDPCIRRDAGLAGPSEVPDQAGSREIESCGSNWQPGQLYFVLPLALRDHALSDLDMAALAVKASAALDTTAASSNKKIGRRVMSVEDALQHPCNDYGYNDDEYCFYSPTAVSASNSAFNNYMIR
uniref:Uncharacterized protein n=1 Tax=Ananas comosus var. bracteatus TaxID=296719 RepID=A0A6V7NXI1_ANACO|nr:unnamed protein product [Ananas comosus var. bracteatus]